MKQMILKQVTREELKALPSTIYIVYNPLSKSMLREITSDKKALIYAKNVATNLEYYIFDRFEGE